MSEWQPIETALKSPLTPAGGRSKLLYGPRLLFWSGGSGSWPITGRWCECADPECGPGWWGMDAVRAGVATHWHPLPAPPTVDTGR